MKTRAELEKMIIEKATNDTSFLSGLKHNPKETIAEFLPEGTTIPDGVNINVVQETPTSLTLVLPPQTKSELNEDELDQVSAGGYLSGGSNTKTQGCDPYPF